MQIRTLHNVPVNTIVNTFNLAFSDYVFPFQLTEVLLRARIQTIHIDLGCSYGAFDNEMLVGLILHGTDVMDGKKVVYNAGTGVIPEMRGNDFTRKLYQHFLPVLKSQGVERCILEVVSSNVPAVKIYTSLGFKTVRTLEGFTGLYTGYHTGDEPDVRTCHIEVNQLQWDKIRTFLNVKPSWQNSEASLKRASGINRCMVLQRNEAVIGFAIYNETGRVHMMAIDPAFRRRGFGRRLISEISERTESNISVLNIEQTASETIRFLESLGLDRTLTQYEMELDW